MRTAHWVPSLVVALSLMVGQQTAESRTDPYWTGLVTSALEYFKHGGFGFEEKKFMNGSFGSPSLPQMGDRVSMALLKIYSPEEMTQAENANACLNAVRSAFIDRKQVSEPSDQDPKVTFFILEYLREKRQSDRNFQKRIDYIKSCVTNFTCSPQGEYDFFVRH
jgi:hypothetical protein